jgi:hypothetical protein
VVSEVRSTPVFRSECCELVKDKLAPLHDIKSFRGRIGRPIAVIILNLDTRRGEWSDSHPARFTPREMNPFHIEKEAGWAPEPMWIF